MEEANMQTYYYHNSSSIIVYSYEETKFDSTFIVPECRIAYGETKIPHRTYYWCNGVNRTDSDICSDILQEAWFLYHKCAAMHDIIRICNIMRHELLQPESLQMTSVPKILIDNYSVDELYKEKMKHLDKIQNALSMDEVKMHFRNFWVSTKNVDNLPSEMFNLNI